METNTNAVTETPNLDSTGKSISQLLDDFESLTAQGGKNEFIEDFPQQGETIQEEEPAQESPSDYQSDYEPQPSPQGLQGVVNADLAINIFGVLMSRLCAIGVGMTGKKTSYKNFTLDKDEKASLKKPLNDYLATLNIQLNNPLYNLLICLSIIYGLKIASVYSDNPEEVEENLTDIRKKAVKSMKPKGESWKGNEMYFQTGEKAGQLKPKFR